MSTKVMHVSRRRSVLPNRRARNSPIRRSGSIRICRLSSPKGDCDDVRFMDVGGKCHEWRSSYQQLQESRRLQESGDQRNLRWATGRPANIFLPLHSKWQQPLGGLQSHARWIPTGIESDGGSAGSRIAEWDDGWKSRSACRTRVSVPTAGRHQGRLARVARRPLAPLRRLRMMSRSQRPATLRAAELVGIPRRECLRPGKPAVRPPALRRMGESLRRPIPLGKANRI